MSLDETLSLEEAAKLSRLGLESFKALVEAGEIPAVRFNQKHTVIVRDQLLGYLRAKAVEQAQERRAGRTPRPRRRGRKVIPPPLTKAGWQG